ncbi:MAG: fasciclin domain-containing protein [Acidimicrobiia bacterium]|nr:fasciclin domain-containing protein [Acidimicrobiia bacterium]
MKTRRKLAVLIAIIALVGTACSSDSSDTTTTTAAATTTTTVVATTTTPMADPTTTTVEATTTTTTEPATNTIVDLVSGTGSLSTLLAAVAAAGLVDTLRGDGPFTVFAPTNDAFAKIPEETLSELLADTEVISRILLYHVVPGEILAADLADLDSVTTLQGSDIALSVEDGAVILNGASMVISTDVTVDNGVIHVIDTAISPPRR